MNKMKLKYLFSIAIILILSFINYTGMSQVRNTSTQTFVQAFQDSRADLLEVTVHSSGKIAEEAWSIEELEKKAYEIAEKLDMLGVSSYSDGVSKVLEYEGNNYEVSIDEDEIQRKVVISGKDPSSLDVSLLLMAMTSEAHKTGATYMVLDARHHDQDVAIEEINQTFNEAFSTFDVSPKLTSAITGSFPGQLSHGEKYVTLSKIIHDVNSTPVESMSNEDLISISAYSPNIEQYIYSGPNKMNLNIAMRYNAYEDKTYLWMGTPIITTEY